MKTPIRTCTGCGAKRPKGEMIRVVARADGKILIDSEGNVCGRGSYVCPKIDCLARARKNGGLERVLRNRVDDRVFEELEVLIKGEQRVSIG